MQIIRSIILALGFVVAFKANAESPVSTLECSVTSARKTDIDGLGILSINDGVAGSFSEGEVLTLMYKNVKERLHFRLDNAESSVILMSVFEDLKVYGDDTILGNMSNDLASYSTDTLFLGPWNITYKSRFEQLILNRLEYPKLAQTLGKPTYFGFYIYIIPAVNELQVATLECGYKADELDKIISEMLLRKPN